MYAGAFRRLSYSTGPVADIRTIAWQQRAPDRAARASTQAAELDLREGRLRATIATPLLVCKHPHDQLEVVKWQRISRALHPPQVVLANLAMSDSHFHQTRRRDPNGDIKVGQPLPGLSAKLGLSPSRSAENDKATSSRAFPLLVSPNRASCAVQYFPFAASPPVACGASDFPLQAGQAPRTHRQPIRV